MSEARYPDPVTRRLLTASVMAATIMAALDTTIANVALPHIQGSVSASQEEITWVLTSYIVSSAIFIPLTGWFANRYGRKRVMQVSIVGFTIASALCGLATNLPELVGFRFLQGMFGAALVPMSQAILLESNPPERHVSAMAVWGMGAMMSPILGPVLGGWLTDNLTWRWVFYVNVPVGIAAVLGITTFLHEPPLVRPSPLDLTGFFLIALALASFQLMLDRGQQQDWFSSTEIWIEAALTVFFLYSFVVHMLTASHPFLPPALFRDLNFVFGSIYGFLLGVLLFSVLALLPTMLEQLLGYPVLRTGLVTMPRGIGSFLSMVAVGPLAKRVNARVLILAGFGFLATSLFMMASFSLQVNERMVMTSGFIGGLGTGLIFVPLSSMAFATLDPRYRNEATSLYTLLRSLGSAVGISILQAMTIRNAATVHARLAEAIRPDNPMLDLRAPGFDFSAPAAVAQMNAQITRQASMVAYIDGYWALLVTILVIVPLLIFMRPPRRGAADNAPPMHLD